MNDKIIIYTDGACSGNPGKGGWGTLILNDGNCQEFYGGDASTTNNKMELTAVIKALQRVGHTDKQISIWTDSQYVKNGMTVWINTWKKHRWINSQREPVKNKDLWITLDRLCAKKNITWHWIKGHNGHPENERVDELARQGIAELD